MEHWKCETNSTPLGFLPFKLLQQKKENLKFPPHYVMIDCALSRKTGKVSVMVVVALCHWRLPTRFDLKSILLSGIFLSVYRWMLSSLRWLLANCSGINGNINNIDEREEEEEQSEGIDGVVKRAVSPRNCRLLFISSGNKTAQKKIKKTVFASFWFLGVSLPWTCIKLQSDSLWGVSSSSSKSSFSRARIFVLRHASHTKSSTNHATTLSVVLFQEVSFSLNLNLWCNVHHL